MLSEHDHAFLKKRKRLAALWTIVGSLMLVTLGAIFLWVFFQTPYIANPLLVAEAIKQNAIEDSVLITAAMLLPIVVMVLFVTVAIFILYGFSIISNEKRYLSMIEKLQSVQSNSHDLD